MAYKYETTVTGIVEKIGGVDNIAHATHYATRFRLKLKDINKLDQEGIQNVNGVLGLRMMDNNEIQIICGTVVNTIYDEFQQITGFKGGGVVNDPTAAKADGVKPKLTPKRIAGIITEYLSGTVAPVIPIYLACGLLLAVLSVATQFFGLSEDSGTYAPHPTPYKSKLTADQEAYNDTFYIASENRDKSVAFMESRGRKWKYGDLDFFIQRQGAGLYMATEGKTGFKIAANCTSIEELQAAVKNKTDADGFDKKIDGIVEKNGISPLYKDENV